MNDQTDRAGARAGRRGLQSIVKLYLSRPPRHALERAEAEIARITAAGLTLDHDHQLPPSLESAVPALEPPQDDAVWPGNAMAEISPDLSATAAAATAAEELRTPTPEPEIADPGAVLEGSPRSRDEGYGMAGRSALPTTDDREFEDEDEGLEILESPDPVLSGISLESADTTSGIVEDALPPQQIGAEALRAELAFKLEEHLGIGEDPLDEIEILFREDSGATGVAEPPDSAIAEIFDMVDRSLALGPGAMIDVEPEASLRIVPVPPVSFPDLEAVAAAETPSEAVHAPRVALLLSTMPPRLRRRLLDTVASPVVSEGRRVLFLESDPSDDETGDLIEEALGLDTAVWRRSLGASPREVLLMRPLQREELFSGLAAEERRSDLVLVGVGLPESILCPRLLQLVDTVIVGLTPQESSVYEAYRALRGVPERRPDLVPYAVTLASSADEAATLFERFRGIATDFLRMPVMNGGWLDLASLPADTSTTGSVGDGGEGPGIAPDLLGVLAEDMGSIAIPPARPARPARNEDPDASIDWPETAESLPRAFFERLSDWFGPSRSS